MHDIPPDLASGLDRLFGSESAALADSFDLFAAMRRRSPVLSYRGAAVVTGHAGVQTVISDARFSKAATSRVALDAAAEAAIADLEPPVRQALDEVLAFEDNAMNMMDPPDHTRVRRIANRAFTPSRVARLRADIERCMHRLLGPIVERGSGDFKELAYSLPLTVISEMLGVPEEDREELHDWSAKIGRNKGGQIAAPVILDARAAIAGFEGYVASIIDRHHAGTEGASELVATLIDAKESERFNAAELASMFVVLIFAGHETTTNLLATGLLELHRAPEQWRQLVEEPELVPNAVEELLRVVSPIQYIRRVALEDVDLPGGTIPQGTSVVACLAAANRDPEVFPDPDRLDVRRDTGRHLALGKGVHFCLGAALARLEGDIALRTLVDLDPPLAVRDGDLRWEGSPMLRSLASLPVAVARRPR